MNFSNTGELKAKEPLFEIKPDIRQFLYPSQTAQLSIVTSITSPSTINYRGIDISLDINIPKEKLSVEFTAVYRKVPEGYIAFIEELPGANTQGETLEEARENLNEAIQLLLETNRTIASEEIQDHEVIRELIKLSA